MLANAGYLERGILQVLGVDELPAYRRRLQSLPLYHWRTRGSQPLKIFVRLFCLREAIGLDEARSLVAPTQLEDWVELGLMQVAGCEVSATTELCPSGSLVIAADWPDGVEPDFHQVMGIAASSRTLAQATIRRYAKATLDLGSGCGVLSLLTSAHSERVAAVDSNPRAVRMTRLNAHLNRVTNIECLEGNLFEPVSGRQFDLILCNPPFVVAPEQFHLHTQSGMAGDTLCETIVRCAPNFLRANGYCQILCNWVQRTGEDWQKRLASWFEASGCDAWILHSHSEDAADYVSNRIAEMALDPADRERLFIAWVKHLEQGRIEAVGFGMINLRRSSRTPNWVRVTTWPEMVGSSGDAIEGEFLRRDFLGAHDDRALLRACFRHAPNLRWWQDQEMGDPGGSLGSTLRFTSGLLFTRKVEPDVAKFVGRCDGHTPLMEALIELADSRGADPCQFAPAFLQVVRGLVEYGFLEPDVARAEPANEA